jgi:signal peptidase I
VTDESTAAETTAAAAEPVEPAAVPAKRPAHHRSFFRELPFLVIIAFVLALLIKHFFVQAFFIPSGSMEQTLHVGDRVLVNKVPYYYRGPHRGEIVVFNGLDSFDDGVTIPPATNPVAKVLRKISSTVGFGAPSEKDYIKRVIGIAGDHVMCCDTGGNVVVTPAGGTPTSLREPYLYRNLPDSSQYFCAAGSTQAVCPPGAPGILVPTDRLWVMGDHRNDSADSRYHVTDSHQGTVPEDKVVGRAFTVVYPFGRAGLLRVPATFEPLALPAAPYLAGLALALPVAGLRRHRKRRPRLS